MRILAEPAEPSVISLLTEDEDSQLGGSSRAAKRPRAPRPVLVRVPVQSSSAEQTPDVPDGVERTKMCDVTINIKHRADGTLYPPTWDDPELQEYREQAMAIVDQARYSHNRKRGVKIMAISIGFEIGKDGTPHMQCMLVLKSGALFKQFLDIMELPGGLDQERLPPRKGSCRIVEFPEKCWEYTQKDGDFACWMKDGYKLPRDKNQKRGVSESYDVVMNMIDESSLDHVEELKDKISVDEAACYMRCYKAIDQVIERRIKKKMRQQPMYEPPNVYWFCGPTGTGKTMFAHQLSGIFKIDETYVRTGAKWCDGISDNCLFVIWDEFRRGDAKFREMLNVLDGYRGIRVEVKGGSRNWRPRCIIFTTPHDPHRTFMENEETKWNLEEGQFEQLTRRIKRVVDFGKNPAEVAAMKNAIIAEFDERFPGVADVEKEQEFVLNNMNA